MKDDNKKAGSSYIYTFYENVQQLNHRNALYLNLLSELDFKYGADISNLKDEDEAKSALMNFAQNLRYYCNVTFTQLSSLHKAINLDPKLMARIDDAFRNTQVDFIIKREYSTHYCILVNEALLAQVIQDLLKTSQDFLEDIYHDKEETNANGH